jgi:hypothetical protein
MHYYLYSSSMVYIATFSSLYLQLYRTMQPYMYGCSHLAERVVLLEWYVLKVFKSFLSTPAHANI